MAQILVCSWYRVITCPFWHLFENTETGDLQSRLFIVTLEVPTRYCHNVDDDSCQGCLPTYRILKKPLTELIGGRIF